MLYDRKPMIVVEQIFLKREKETRGDVYVRGLSSFINPKSICEGTGRIQE
jgi:hypothetical protein